MYCGVESSLIQVKLMFQQAKYSVVDTALIAQPQDGLTLFVQNFPREIKVASVMLTFGRP